MDEQDARPESPCVGVCTLDKAQVCEGCGRTIQEIAEWSRASSARQAQIVAAAALRRPRSTNPAESSSE